MERDNKNKMHTPLIKINQNKTKTTEFLNPRRGYHHSPNEVNPLPEEEKEEEFIKSNVSVFLRTHLI